MSRQGPGPVARYLGRTLSTAATHVGPARPLLRAVNRRLWDRAAPHWDARMAGREGRTAPLDLALDVLSPDVARAADLGTGTGAGALHLAQRFPDARITGVDLSPEMVRTAQAKLDAALAGRVDFVVATAERPPFADGELDLLVQLNVPLMAQGLARVVRPGGLLLVVSSLGAGTPFHTPHRTAARLVGRAGFDVVPIPGARPETVLAARRR